jgi:cephalosporin hydroxylase
VKLDPKNPRSFSEEMARDEVLRQRTKGWMDHAARYKYTYGFTWLGLPIIQQPQDIVAIQEVIWKVKPDLIIETGIAHGGSLILSASILEILQGNGLVVGIDIDIREHNRQAIEAHPLAHRITMIQGSSTDVRTVRKVQKLARERHQALVILDSNHTHEHVLKELKIYSDLVKKGSYIIVCDTRIEDAAPEIFSSSPWGRGNNPKTAVWEFLKENDRFVVDSDMENKLLLTANPDGFLKCIKS